MPAGIFLLAIIRCQGRSHLIQDYPGNLSLLVQLFLYNDPHLLQSICMQIRMMSITAQVT